MSAPDSKDGRVPEKTPGLPDAWWHRNGPVWEAGSGIAANRLSDREGVLGPLGTCLAWMDQLS